MKVSKTVFPNQKITLSFSNCINNSEEKGRLARIELELLKNAYPQSESSPWRYNLFENTFSYDLEICPLDGSKISAINEKVIQVLKGFCLEV